MADSELCSKLADLVGRCCFYKDASWIGIARIVSVKSAGPMVRLVVSVPVRGASGARRERATECPSSGVRIAAGCVTFNAGYGINAKIVIDPAKIAELNDIRRHGGSVQDLIDAVNRRGRWPRADEA